MIRVDALMKNINKTINNHTKKNSYNPPPPHTQHAKEEHSPTQLRHINLPNPNLPKPQLLSKFQVVIPNKFLIHKPNNNQSHQDTTY